MLPATIFRRFAKQHSGLYMGVSEMVTGSGVTIPSSNVMNCLNRYAAATGFIRISFLDFNQYRNWYVAKLRLYADRKRQVLQQKTIKGRHILQGVLEKRRESLIERKKILAEARHKMKEKVRDKLGEVMERENIVTIPNILTMSRMVLSPYIGYVIINGDYKLALSLLAIAGISDMLDGQIARRWPNQASKVGSFLDPAADKVLMGSLVIPMTFCDLLPLWLAGVILFRDVFLIIAGFIIRYISLPPPRTLTRYFDATYVTAQLEPTLISKINTGVQLATIGISLAAPVWHFLDHPYLSTLWFVTGATTVAAAFSYILNKNTFKIFKRPTRKT